MPLSIFHFSSFILLNVLTRRTRHKDKQPIKPHATRDIHHALCTLRAVSFTTRMFMTWLINTVYKHYKQSKIVKRTGHSKMKLLIFTSLLVSCVICLPPGASGPEWRPVGVNTRTALGAYYRVERAYEGRLIMESLLRAYHKVKHVHVIETILDNAGYSKTCLKRPLIIGKKVLETNGSLMMVERIENGLWCIQQYF